MNNGKGEQWLIDFQTKLREKLPNHIICHAPQGPYFDEDHYRNGDIKGAYMTIHRRVGMTIDFYTIQFYNQDTTGYDTYEGLFEKSVGWSKNTAVQELINKGIPAKKIVVGKPAIPADAMNTGYVASGDLGKWAALFKTKSVWQPSFMFWQYSNDKNLKNQSILKTVLHYAGVNYADSNDTTKILSMK